MPARWRFVELVGLCGLVVVQPILDVYAKNPLELISRQVEGLAVVWFVVVVLLAPAAMVLLVEQAAGLAGQRWTQRVHRVALALLAACFVMLVFPSERQLALVALIAGVVAGFACWHGLTRIAALRQWLRLLAITPVLFVGIFLSSDGIHELTFDSTPAPVALERGGRSPSVMVVVLDELPTSSLLDSEGNVDGSRYPHFAALAADATWYRNEATFGSWTSIAVPGILTGRYPDPVSNRAHWSTYPENLFTLLGGRYRIVAHETETRLCPRSVCGDARPTSEAVVDLARSATTVWEDMVNPFEELQVAFEPAAGGVAKSDIEQVAVETARELATAKEPTLAYVHFSLPHQPWLMTGTGQQTNAPTRAPGSDDGRWADSMAAASAYQRHLLQLGFADAVLGDIVDELEAAGRYDDTLLVVASDHGVSFRDGEPERAISEENLPDVAFPPLFIKAPGQEKGAVDDRPAQTVDVLPTIADLLDIEVPWHLDGVSLADDDPLQGRARRYVPGGDDLRGDGEGGTFVLPDTPLVDLLRDSGRPVGSAAALTALGTDLDLAGRRITAEEEGGQRDGRVVVDGGRALLDLDRSADPVPLFVDLIFAQDEPGVLAVAVNGTIAVTGRVGGPDDRHLWLVIPPDRVQDGRNDVQVYRVTGSSGDPTLTPVETVLD